MNFRKTKKGNISINCKSNCTYPVCCFVCVLDSCGKPVVSEYTNCLGKAEFSVVHSGKYKLIISAAYLQSPLRQWKWVTLNKDKCYSFCFIFNQPYRSKPCTDVTVRVSDIHYPNQTFEGVELQLGILSGTNH